jgi:hypothetical protein
MATKKSAVGGGQSAVPENGAATRKIDAVALADELEDRIGEFGVYGNKYYMQRRLVEELREKLAEAEATLEFLARPLRIVEKALAPDTLAKLAREKPYDEGLRACAGQIRLKVESKPSGAKPWKLLKADGATDEQILKNLRSTGRNYHGVKGAGYELVDSRGRDGFVLWKGDANFQGSTKAIVGTANVVAEVRRVFEIPPPAKGASAAKAATKKPAAKRKASAPKKQPAAAKAPSAKPATKKYLSGAEKRKRKAEREAAVAKPAKGTTFNGKPVATRTQRKQRAAAEPARQLIPVPDYANAVGIFEPVRHFESTPAVCCECGCTAAHACKGGCWWVNNPTSSIDALCSRCLPVVLDRKWQADHADGQPAATLAPGAELGSATPGAIAAHERRNGKGHGVVNTDEVPAKFKTKRARRGALASVSA